MKLVYTYVFCLIFAVAFAQDKTHSSYFDVNYYKGNIALHNNEILHLITGHPEGVILSWNKKTYGFEDWEQRFNYPDYGVSFAYQGMKSPVLGNNYSLYAHYNFYFLNRNLMFRIGQGIGYNTNPYHRETNFKNVAFGTKFGSSTYVMLNYKKERIIDRFGVQAGFSLIHYSNANVKSPNNGTNSITFNVGLNYNLEATDLEYQNTLDKKADQDFSESIKYNLVFRTGINESDIVGSGQYAMYVLSAYADKRINKTSALQLGADIFFSNFLKELIFYQSVAFPERGLSGNEDHKRIGVFAGHELFINKTSLITQLGYYIYYPFDFEGQTYARIGLKRYFSKKWFGALTLKAHGAKAEGVEFGLGVRL
ncbi:MAG: acyloxyacyl hydrolase [Algibacter sp.]|uniref:acyloxyacyl hydrolase n=1 Tax=Algibacter sp. TaxID=1872428 RepID=UPI002612E845|nr:acyloxyacyl hydrolase [Algibacter sp.]MDG1728454.1 acyloxyacyl hydrolase [Algibacter sp.]MDG2178140.1 acyloxyacyl hydrolase [Algibacter sp.]